MNAFKERQFTNRGGPLFPFAPRAADSPARDALDVLATEQGVLAVITATEGPSYRPVGAIMAFPDHERPVGSLSSGCIEADLACQAVEASREGKPRLLRYGRGSPYFDLQLPCGGGLEILLVPQPDRGMLQRVLDLRQARQGFAIRICLQTGALSLGQDRPSARLDDAFWLRIRPEPRFLIFGKGPEIPVFAGLVASALYPGLVLSHDEETLDAAALAGLPVRRIGRQGLPPDIGIDRDTAAILFYHEHERETAILKALLGTDAFYIGAQGSRRARDSRLAALRDEGVGEPALSRLHGPIGLVPSARDPRLLAVSVLAEILGQHAEIGRIAA